MKDTFRIFYAHSAAEDEATTREVCTEMAQKFKAKFAKHYSQFDLTPGKEIRVSVIPGRVDFEANFQGDWDAWAGSISQRLDSITLKPHFDLIVVPNEYVGRATAAIVNVAVLVGRPVFLFKDSTISRISQVKIGDPDDWQGGFELSALPSPSPSQKPWDGEGTQPSLPLIHKEDPRGSDT